LSTFTSAVAEAEAAEVVAAAEDALADALAEAVAEADADAVAVVVVEEDWEPHALRPSAPAKAMDRTAVVFFIAGRMPLFLLVVVEYGAASWRRIRVVRGILVWFP
jgi:hypothetical protein